MSVDKRTIDQTIWDVAINEITIQFVNALITEGIVKGELVDEVRKYRHKWMKNKGQVENPDGWKEK